MKKFSMVLFSGFCIFSSALADVESYRFYNNSSTTKLVVNYQLCSFEPKTCKNVNKSSEISPQSVFTTQPMQVDREKETLNVYTVTAYEANGSVYTMNFPLDSVGGSRCWTHYNGSVVLKSYDVDNSVSCISNAA